MQEIRPIRGDLAGLIACLKELESVNDCIVVAISGFVGAGKSSVADRLHATLPDVAVICIDEFIIDQLQGDQRCWGDVDWKRLAGEVLLPIHRGAKNIAYGVYDWTQNTIISTRKLTLPKYLIIEGVGLLRPDLADFFDFTIWLDVPLEVAEARGMKRDLKQNNLEYVQKWQIVCAANDRDYFDQFRPMGTADFLLTFNL